MATRGLAVSRPRHRTSLPAQPARVRSLLFDGKLVSRLYRLLRHLRGRQETLRGSRPGRTSKADHEERCRRTCRNRRSRLRVPPPVWERTPMRVTFQPDDDQKLVFSIRGRVVEVINDAE